MAVRSDGFLERALGYRADVARYLYRFTRHFHDAEDLTAETYARLIDTEELDHLTDRAVQMYVLKTARSVWLDWLEKQRHICVEFTADPEEGSLIALNDGPEQQLIVEQSAACIQQTLEAMPKARRQVFELWLYGKLRPAGIAERLGGNKNTVKKHIVRALQQLRQALCNQGGSHDHYN